MKKVRYLIEAAFVWLIFLIFRVMPYKMASSCGGWIGRTIGPKLGASRKAHNNIMQALPGKTDDEYQKLVLGMWDNLGRVIAEYPHLVEISGHVDVDGKEHLEGLPETFVVLCAHAANWELGPVFFNHMTNYPLTTIYRAPNNPYVEPLLEKCRDAGSKGSYAPKSTGGSRTLVRTLQDGGRVCILFDQKYNQGIKASFFGRPAMTSSSFAQLARKYDCPILPAWIERTDGANFRINIEPSFKVDGRSDEEMVDLAHAMLEKHILKRPEQWLWLHRRWIS